MSETMRIGIIGTGIIAHEHARAIHAIDGLALAAVSNRTREKALDFAKLHGVEADAVYDHWTSMIDEQRLDAVVVCLANDLHAQVFEDCAARNIPVLMEKPLAHTSADCVRMRQTEARTGTKLMVGHTQRYQSCLIEARNIVESGRLGNLVAVRDRITYDYFWKGRPQWFLDPVRCGGGILMNYGVHTFDRVIALTGKPVQSVHAHVDWEIPGCPVDSSYQVQSLHAGSLVSTMTCTGYCGPFESSMEFYGTHGVLRVNLVGTRLSPEGVWIGNGTDFEQIPVQKGNAYVNEMAAFVAYAKDDQPCPVDSLHGYAMVRLVEASYQSHREGCVVAL